MRNQQDSGGLPPQNHPLKRSGSQGGLRKLSLNGKLRFVEVVEQDLLILLFCDVPLQLDQTRLLAWVANMRSLRCSTKTTTRQVALKTHQVQSLVLLE